MQQKGAPPELDLPNFPRKYLDREIDEGVFKSLTKEAGINQYLSGYTVLSHSKSHGSQVEYTDNVGKAYLWYPKNRTVVEGKWRTEARSKADELCFKYPKSSINRVTNKRGGSWECRWAVIKLADDVQRVKGDPFNLKSGKIPFVMPKNVYPTLEMIAVHSGVELENLRSVSAMRK